MFGALIPGQALNVQFQQIEQTRWMLTVPNQPSKPISQIAVFLLPNGQQIPAGFGCAVYLSDASQNFEYFGCLLNEDPSKIFSVPSTFNDTSNNTLFGSMQSNQQGVLYIGITLEKIENLQNLEGTNFQRQQKEANNTVGLAQFIADDLFKFLQSFVRPDNSNKDILVLPTNAIDSWLQKFTNKLRVDPNFWKKRK
ncbi:OPI10 [Acrasis kona]|uniref:OPI10 n=1 Tax=Acrasis kona TaxID=1008807 RepID=A0AAW2Z6P5_9EUKA